MSENIFANIRMILIMETHSFCRPSVCVFFFNLYRVKQACCRSWYALILVSKCWNNSLEGYTPSSDWLKVMAHNMTKLWFKLQRTTEQVTRKVLMVLQERNMASSSTIISRAWILHESGHHSRPWKKEYKIIVFKKKCSSKVRTHLSRWLSAFNCSRVWEKTGYLIAHC